MKHFLFRVYRQLWDPNSVTQADGNVDLDACFEFEPYGS